ncbi:unnamed protein product [Closterium sp. NIES-65]|nr:unnamed protein product [Closterium sp. NIES-65]
MEVPPSVEITDGQRLETEQLQDESSMDGVQQTGERQIGEQQIGEQQSGEQQSGEQQIGEERIEEQQMVDQQLGEQQTGEPQTGEQEIADRTRARAAVGRTRARAAAERTRAQAEQSAQGRGQQRAATGSTGTGSNGRQQAAQARAATGGNGQRRHGQQRAATGGTGTGSNGRQQATQARAATGGNRQHRHGQQWAAQARAATSGNGQHRHGQQQAATGSIGIGSNRQQRAAQARAAAGGNGQHRHGQQRAATGSTGTGSTGRQQAAQARAAIGSNGQHRHGQQQGATPAQARAATGGNGQHRHGQQRAATGSTGTGSNGQHRHGQQQAATGSTGTGSNGRQRAAQAQAATSGNRQHTHGQQRAATGSTGTGSNGRQQAAQARAATGGNKQHKHRQQQATTGSTGMGSHTESRSGSSSSPCTIVDNPPLDGTFCWCTDLDRVEAILFDEPLTKPLDDITEARQLLAVKLRQVHDFQFEQCVDPHRGSLEDVYTEEQFRILVSDILPYWAKEYFREPMSFPSQSLWRALAVRVMILMAHHMLGRGISIREIHYCNIFTHVLPPITNSKGESSLHVLVVAYRSSKTIKDSKLGHLYLTQHMDFRQCGFGAVFMWIHFIFDLVPLHYNNDKIVPPLDFSNPTNWPKKHLFFALFDKDKTELPYVTHAKWINWAMKSAEWILTKVTHIFRRSAAQILADKNYELDNIAQLGQWDMNEMRRSYVTGIPRGAIQLQAGFTTEPGDYYLGRSKSEVPAKVVKAIEEHIFPKAEQWLDEAMEWNNEQDKEHMFFAAKSFLKALQAARMAIAEDLAMYYVHCDDHPFDGVTVCDCERHPYAQMSGLCKDMDFQKWALDVYLLDKYGIEMWTNPMLSRASVRWPF